MAKIHTNKNKIQNNGKTNFAEFYVFTVEQRTYSRKGEIGMPILMKIRKNLFVDLESAESYRNERLRTYLNKYPQSEETLRFEKHDRNGSFRDGCIKHTRENVKNNIIYMIDTEFHIQKTPVFKYKNN